MSKSKLKSVCHDQPCPRNWPEDVSFLSDQTYSLAVTTETQAALGRTTAESANFPRIIADLWKPPNPRVKICTIAEEKHPACGQRGLFAAQPLAPNTFICLYLGHVHTNSLSDTDPHSDYDLNLDGDLGLSVDAGSSGNESRFVNDYRGIAERPNVEFVDCMIEVPCTKRAGGLKWERRVGICVLSAGKAGKRKKGVMEGEEILVTYGKGFWEGRKMLGKFRKDDEMLRIATLALDA